MPRFHLERFISALHQVDMQDSHSVVQFVQKWGGKLAKREKENEFSPVYLQAYELLFEETAPTLGNRWICWHKKERINFAVLTKLQMLINKAQEISAANYLSDFSANYDRHLILLKMLLATGIVKHRESFINQAQINIAKYLLFKNEKIPSINELKNIPIFVPFCHYLRNHDDTSPTIYSALADVIFTEEQFENVLKAFEGDLRDVMVGDENNSNYQKEIDKVNQIVIRWKTIFREENNNDYRKRLINILKKTYHLLSDKINNSSGHRCQSIEFTVHMDESEIVSLDNNFLAPVEIDTRDAIPMQLLTDLDDEGILQNILQDLRTFERHSNHKQVVATVMATVGLFAIIFGLGTGALALLGALSGAGLLVGAGAGLTSAASLMVGIGLMKTGVKSLIQPSLTESTMQVFAEAESRLIV